MGRENSIWYGGYGASASTTEVSSDACFLLSYFAPQKIGSNAT